MGSFPEEKRESKKWLSNRSSQCGDCHKEKKLSGLCFSFSSVVLEATVYSVSVKYMSETFVSSFNKASSPQSLTEGIDDSEVVGYREATFCHITLINEPS